MPCLGHPEKIDKLILEKSLRVGLKLQAVTSLAIAMKSCIHFSEIKHKYTLPTEELYFCLLKCGAHQT